MSLIVDKHFSIAQYLESKGFLKVESGDNRCYYRLDGYLDAWEDCAKSVTVIIHHQYGYIPSTSQCGQMMEVRLNDALIYNGLQPFNFDYAENLFELLLPTIEEYKKIYHTLCFFGDDE